MTQEEYLKSRKDEEEAFAARMRALDSNFARSLNKVKIGDVVEDRYGKKIIVQHFMLNRYSEYYGVNLPHYDYRGILLCKNGKPRKDGTIITIGYDNIVEINGKEVKLESYNVKEGGKS